MDSSIIHSAASTADGNIRNGNIQNTNGTNTNGTNGNIQNGNGTTVKLIPLNRQKWLDALSSKTTRRLHTSLPSTTFKQTLLDSIRTGRRFHLPQGYGEPSVQLWHCFRFGTVLCSVLNAFSGGCVEGVYSVEEVMKTPNLAKVNLHRFLAGVRDNMSILAGPGGGKVEVFTVAELYSNESDGGFVKALMLVNLILDRVDGAGAGAGGVTDIGVSGAVITHSDADISSSSNSNNDNIDISGESQSLDISISHKQRKVVESTRGMIIKELMDTERNYVTDLHRLLTYKQLLHTIRALSDGVMTQIFANIDHLFEFEQGLLNELEKAIRHPEQSVSHHLIAQTFINNEPVFVALYTPFCSNYNASDTALLYKDVLEGIEGGLEPVRELPGYLIKPIQRICRFPLLFKELVKHTSSEMDPQLNFEFQCAYEAMQRATNDVNEARRREENRHVAQDLFQSVDNWQGLRTEEFGELLLHDNLVMLTESIEKDVHLFLFERILISCKEIRKERKSKVLSFIRRSTVSSSTVSATTAVEYSLRGRVAVTSIEGLTLMSNETKNDIKLFYKDRETLEINWVVLRFLNPEPMRRWKSELDQLLDRHKRRSAPAHRHRRTKSSASAATTDTASRRGHRTSRPLQVVTTRIDGPSAPQSAYESPRVSTAAPSRICSTHFNLASPLSQTPLSSRRLSSISNNTSTSLRRPSLVRSMGSAPASSPKTLRSLDQVLHDLDNAIQQGYFEDSENNGGNNDDLAMGNRIEIPPPLPTIHEIRKPATEFKVKVHHRDDNMILLVDPANFTLNDLYDKIRSRIGHELTRLRYQDEDGDFITIYGQEDLDCAVKLCLPKGVMNLFM